MAGVIAFRRAAILAVGSELLTPFRIDTNSLHVTERLNAAGVDVAFKAVIGDNRQELAHVVREAIGKVDLLVVSGGLGPTDDDVTRDAVADVLGLTMREDAAITEQIRQRFASRGWTMPEINRRQAMVPERAEVLPNPNGTAPGLWIEHERGAIVLLPGPPRELKPMLARVIEERLTGRTGTMALRRVMRCPSRRLFWRRWARSNCICPRAATTSGASTRRSIVPSRRYSRYSAPMRTAPTDVRSRRSSATCSRRVGCTSRWPSRARAG
jgi:molybdenum cofactor synthesis domain-containing protein